MLTLTIVGRMSCLDNPPQMIPAESFFRAVYKSNLQRTAGSLDCKEVLYRIIQETFNNVIKHAHASRVNLSLACPGDKIMLEIKDNEFSG